jgi:hypothetical protein
LLTLLGAVGPDLTGDVVRQGLAHPQQVAMGDGSETIAKLQVSLARGGKHPLPASLLGGGQAILHVASWLRFMRDVLPTLATA